MHYPFVRDTHVVLHCSRFHEWYQSYKNLRHLLNPIHFAAQGNGVRAWSRRASTSQSVVSFPPRDACRVLILGCGNSLFGEDMRKDGWNGRMMNVDYSQVVIDQMKERHDNEVKKSSGKKSAPMEFMCHDITTGLPFDDESFDLIVAKGTFDAVLCSAGSVGNTEKLVQECVRCLMRGHGVFFVVTHGNPDNRQVYLEHDNEISHHWDGVSVHTVDRPLSGL